MTARSAFLRCLVLLAASFPRVALAAPAVQLDSGSGRVLTLPHAAANVFVADSKVAEVRPASPTTLFIFGVGTGRTTVAALDAAGSVVSQFDVTVQPSTFGAARAEAEIRRVLPRSHVSVQALPAGLLLTGTVDTAADASQALVIARAYAADKQAVDNQITIRQSQQVTLKVRIAEMSRTLTRGLGIDWQALGAIGQIGKLPAFGATLNGSSVSTLASVPISGSVAATLTNGQGSAGASAALDFLASAGLVRMLAEPNLTVISGQPASFLVGGQFPVPVPGTLGQTTIDYKSYGVSLSFVPTIFSDGRISIHVAPEVSQLSTTNSVTVASSGSSIIVPSLTMRRAETTVELGSGQTFAIAGLLQDSMTGNRSALPYLQDLPILGPAFRDDQFTRGETEIVILVTPYLVNPVNDPTTLQIPTNGPITTDMDRMLYMRTAPGSNQRSLAATPDVAGFIVQ